MTKTEILALFIDDVKERQKQVKDFLSDHSNSFEDRKEVFLKTPYHLYSTYPWSMNLPIFEKKYGRLNWYDMGISRGSVVNLQDWIKDDWYDGTFEDENGELDREKRDLFIKEVVDLGVHEFTYDW
jgi:hypothetical protein